ncbi:MAG TPA: hypothetical protein VMV86_05780 [Methanosarcinales archaeon]|nr:hypothetical protein [Methanosarcinales archaeon]
MKINNVSKLGVDVDVRNNLNRTSRNEETGLVTQITDKSSYKVRISEEALKLLLKYHKLYNVIPRLEKPELHIYTREGKLVG